MIEAIASVAANGSSTAVNMTSGVMETKELAGPSFIEALKSTSMDTLQTVQQSEQMASAAMHGKASLQEVVQATVKAEVAVETAISIRNKMIESYQEIMRMPI
ncbi:MAG: flagellar hook-basal body complex protein FliE [Pseudomonadota bacterium]